MPRPSLVPRRSLALVALVALLPGCAGVGGPALVSAQSPPGTGAVNSNSEPQPVGSLPPGAANSSVNIPTSYQPNNVAFTFGGLRR